MLDEMTRQNASIFAIFHIGILKPKVAFSIFYFVVLYFFPNEWPVDIDQGILLGKKIK